ncbi:MAG: tRNA (adenosine(37)-N6)-dimethylallyltransferase MiaA [Clostridia bacterium]|nr:tRNA (adenosine(37)-N6)-dimethylallyltransferase MiaA [Clostridia bacterium]
MQSHPLIVISGPTASGKTATALALCTAHGGEVISCDSMQVYRGMDIGTAKPTVSERRNVRHHMIDIVNPDTNYTVSDFSLTARPIVDDLLCRGVQPVLCGGSGLYVDSIVKPMRFAEKSSEPIRNALKSIAAGENGREELHARLAAVDPVAANRLHPNDIRRVIRALEVYELTGHTITQQQAEDRMCASDYLYKIFALDWPRETLYRRINERVDIMIDEGLEREVEKLLDQGLTIDLTSMQGLGYKEMYYYFIGETTLDQAIQNIKQGTRHYAKRQLTWLKRSQDVVWLDAQGRSPDSLANEILEECKYNG